MKVLTFLLILYSFAHEKIQAQSNGRLQIFNLSSQHVAIDGYDAVAYFKQGQPVKGKASLAVSHEGVIYHFASIENKTDFLRSPSLYEPQYGGWCAYAMGATGEKVDVDPETFKIVNGKLYLFYNKYFNNTLKSWNKDEKSLNPRADVNWKKIYNPKL
jgi:YHS domain-containing protein